MIGQLQKPRYAVFQLDGTAYPGSSGSPLYDPETGLVYGVINMVFVKGTKEAALSNPSGITYAIPGLIFGICWRAKINIQHHEWSIAFFSELIWLRQLLWAIDTAYGAVFIIMGPGCYSNMCRRRELPGSFLADEMDAQWTRPMLDGRSTPGCNGYLDKSSQ